MKKTSRFGCLFLYIYRTEAFALYTFLFTTVLNLIPFIVYSNFSLSFPFFHRVKEPKRPSQTKIVVYSFCSRVALQHRSAVINLPLQSCLFRAGCCETRYAWLYKRNYTHATLRQSCTMACSQQEFTFNFRQCRFSFWNYLYPREFVVRMFYGELLWYRNTIATFIKTSLKQYI